MSDDWKLHMQYDRQIRNLTAELNEIKEKNDALISRNNELYQEGRDCWKEALLFKQKVSMFRNFCIFFAALFVFFFFLFVNCYFHFSQLKPASQSNTLSYSVGYNDAISGIRPDAELVQCYVCGYYSPEYHADEITFFDLNSLWIPICSSCLDNHQDSPIEILGEEFVFSPITID